jgi:hypothetical protein
VLHFIAAAISPIRHKLFFPHTLRSFGAEFCGTLLTVRILFWKNAATALFRTANAASFLVPYVHFLIRDQSEALMRVHHGTV